MMTPPNPALLNLQNVRVMRGDKIVLDDLSVKVAADERVAILGPNGCGKSTLVKTITRECYPVVRAGSSMTILGQQQWNIFELRSMLGIVSNDLMSAVTGDATGLDVVLSGFFSSISIFTHHRVTASQREMAHATLSKLQVGHLVDRPVCKMSSGEAKRILIARALVHQPLALLFDEPSNSLDVSARHSLRQTMSLLANSGIGIIMVTHELSDIVPEIQRVLLMRNGRIIADGRKEEILSDQQLGDLFGTKVAVARHDGFYHLW